MIVDVSHSVYNIVGRLFSLEQNSIWLCGQAFTSFQHGLFMSEEMLRLHNFIHLEGVSENIIL